MIDLIGWTKLRLKMFEVQSDEDNEDNTVYDPMVEDLFALGGVMVCPQCEATYRISKAMIQEYLRGGCHCGYCEIPTQWLKYDELG